MIKVNKKGFTLVELLLATAMFSFILLFVTFAIVQVSRAYNKGITVKKTQETARAVMQEMTRAISTATSGSSGTDAVIKFSNTTPRRLCVGDLRFGWNEGFRPSGPGRETYSNGQDFALTRSDSGACNDDFDQSQSIELIDERLTVQDISIQEVLSGSVYNLCVVITVNNASDVTAGDCNNEPRCNVLSGDTYCDVARLQTTVTLRR